MSVIKAIQTEYKGYLFRSRLEARWAVFFDALNEPWEYEKEGFDFGTRAGRYLPDFFLPRLDMWLEVKGQVPNKDEVLKCEALQDATDKSVLLVSGPPSSVSIDGHFPDYTIFCWDIGDSSAGASNWSFIFQCFQKKGLCIWVSSDREIGNDCCHMFKNERLFSDEGLPSDWSDKVMDKVFDNAVKRSRSARFEYGHKQTSTPLISFDPKEAANRDVVFQEHKKHLESLGIIGWYK